MVESDRLTPTATPTDADETPNRGESSSSSSVELKLPKTPANPIKPLPIATEATRTARAQGFLVSAHESVVGLFGNLGFIRVLAGATRRRADLRGPLHEGQIDLLRAAIVFVAAGMDATVKQLVRDALPMLVKESPTALEKLTDYATTALVDSAGQIRGKALAGYLLSGDIREALMESYVTHLTGDSLQSVQQLEKALTALGVTDSALRKDIAGLRPLFMARNEIVHELDLKHTTKPYERGRRVRRLSEVAVMCNLGLQITQRILNTVSSSVRSARESEKRAKL
jgi:hypothetical protein